MIHELNVRVSPKVAYDESELDKLVLKETRPLGCKVNDFRVVKRSIDARKKDIKINLTIKVATGEDLEVAQPFAPVVFHPVMEDAPKVIIVGAGPAGLFAALKALQLGWRPIVLERGVDVDQRRIDLANISREGRINPSSNYCFGEGGAGAYSDGKLYTRSKKRGDNEEVLRLLVQHGARPDILVDAHPHIGSDKLPNVIKGIRQTILDNGGEVHFSTTVESLIMNNGEAVGVHTDKGDFEGDGVILAIGHSAHDTFRSLHSSGVKMEPKGLAIGVRLEHPQKHIDRIQYHSPEGRGRYLPAAEYNFVTQVDGRGVYSFCMCPGGVIVPAGSGSGELVVNGMSASARAGNWSNSGMVVEIRPGDFPKYGKFEELELLQLQEDLEYKFFEESGKSINAPAQRMVDFTNHKVSETLPATSYAPGIHPADFHSLFPKEIAGRLEGGFREFGKRAKGFLTNEAILVGLESRTSSPVRFPRDKEKMEHVEIEGLYPVGEGAGYAGGIVSAAVDGIKGMEALAKNKNV